MKFRADIALSIAAVLVAVATFFASPLWNLRFKDEKKLQYSLVRSPVTQRSLKSKVSADVYVQTSDGRRLVDPVVWSVSVENTGLVPITKGDFEIPISISVDKPGSVIRALVVDSEPAGIEPQVEMKGEKVVVEPLLLNPGDAILIHLLVHDDAKVTNVMTRGAALSIERQNPARETGLYVASVIDWGQGTSTYRTHVRLFAAPLIAAEVVFALLGAVAYVVGFRMISNVPAVRLGVLLTVVAMIFVASAFFVATLVRRSLVLSGAPLAAAEWAPLVLLVALLMLVVWKHDAVDRLLGRQ